MSPSCDLAYGVLMVASYPQILFLHSLSLLQLHIAHFFDFRRIQKSRKYHVLDTYNIITGFYMIFRTQQRRLSECGLQKRSLLNEAHTLFTASRDQSFRASIWSTVNISCASKFSEYLGRIDHLVLLSRDARGPSHHLTPCSLYNTLIPAQSSPAIEPHTRRYHPTI